MAQQFVEMDWIGNHQFNTFINKVGIIPTPPEETVKEVTENNTYNDEIHLANIRVEFDHLDLNDRSEP